MVNCCQQVRKVNVKYGQCEECAQKLQRCEDTERLRPGPEEEVEVTSVRERERNKAKSKIGQKMCTGNDEIVGRSSPH